jgi:hypothetical protein
MPHKLVNDARNGPLNPETSTVMIEESIGDQYKAKNREEISPKNEEDILNHLDYQKK